MLVVMAKPAKPTYHPPINCREHTNTKRAAFRTIRSTNSWPKGLFCHATNTMDLLDKTNIIGIEMWSATKYGASQCQLVQLR